MKLKLHFAGDEVHVAADFCRQGRCQQPMDHQSAPLVRRDVMHALIARYFIEQSDIRFSESTIPGNDISSLHRDALRI